jgi:CTP:molybdopterin cytidylyltransferase MocA
MSVAAIVLAPEPVVAQRDPDGRSIVRVVADIALAGGAIPTVVVSTAPDAVRPDLVGTDAIVAVPEPGVAPGIAWFAFGAREAAATQSGTTAALLWPGRHCWVDPETITSLIEAHGVRPDVVLRPSFDGEPGFPVLVPVGYVAELEDMAGLHGPEAIERLAARGAPVDLIDLGDPGTVHDVSTARDDLPAYRGPDAPTSGRTFEWGSAAAETPEEPEGPG